MCKKGFTLIEMLVVVAIVILLTAISVPSVAKIQKHYNEIKVKSAKDQIESAKTRVVQSLEQNSSIDFDTQTHVLNGYLSAGGIPLGTPDTPVTLAEINLKLLSGTGFIFSTLGEYNSVTATITPAVLHEGL